MIMVEDNDWKKDLQTIYTVDFSGSVMYPVMRQMFGMSDEDFYKQLWEDFAICCDRLKVKNVSYGGLKPALIPSQDKKHHELCLVFDTQQISDVDYGNKVFDVILSLLDKDGTFSVCDGDYLGEEWMQDKMRDELMDKITQCNNSTFLNSHQYYIVYLSRITERRAKDLVHNLQQHKWFYGYGFIDNDSLFKSHLANTLPTTFVKHNSIVISLHPSDCNDEDNVNIRHLPFKKHGFRCISINEDSFSTFLSYKISTMRLYKDDANLPFNVLFPRLTDMSQLKLGISDTRWEEYLMSGKNGKNGILASLPPEYRSKEGFIKQVYSRMCKKHIFNLRRHLGDGTLLFDVCIELPTLKGHIRKTKVGLKYLPDIMEMQIVTIT